MSLSHLIPLTTFHSGFTTCCFNVGPRRQTACPSPVIPGVDSVALHDPDLGVHYVESRTSHPLVIPPYVESELAMDGTNSEMLTNMSEFTADWVAPSLAWEAFYPNGSINPSGSIAGGFGFYLFGPPSFASRLEGATHVILSYRMMLQNDWEWVKGGKLPGIFGGEGNFSYACTGGRQENRSQCFNIRPMWRSKGQGELYTYLPLTPSNRERLLAVPPLSEQNAQYGLSVGRNAFQFDPAVGKWISLAFRVKLNAVGSEDGELELWVDGKSVINVSGLTFRNSEQSRIKGGHFQTFFGGHTDDWASPKDQRAWFADLSGVIID
ncbi:polysaccharide lyase family 14 protein [Mycena galericulata]|nr:polysaccharide lyase family 14 protein [Mycena galericulata]